MNTREVNLYESQCAALFFLRHQQGLTVPGKLRFIDYCVSPADARQEFSISAGTFLAGHVTPLGVPVLTRIITST